MAAAVLTFTAQCQSLPLTHSAAWCLFPFFTLSLSRARRLCLEIHVLSFSVCPFACLFRSRLCVFLNLSLSLSLSLSVAHVPCWLFATACFVWCSRTARASMMMAATTSGMMAAITARWPRPHTAMARRLRTALAALRYDGSMPSSARRARRSAGAAVEATAGRRQWSGVRGTECARDRQTQSSVEA